MLEGVFRVAPDWFILLAGTLNAMVKASSSHGLAVEESVYAVDASDQQEDGIAAYRLG